MSASVPHCPRCGQSLRARDVQCESCLCVVARTAHRVNPMLPCGLVLIAGAAMLLWQLGGSLL